MKLKKNSFTESNKDNTFSIASIVRSCQDRCTQNMVSQILDFVCKFEIFWKNHQMVKKVNICT